MRNILLIIGGTLILSCTVKLKMSISIKEIVLNELTKDSVITFLKKPTDTLSIFREVEIIKNDNTDTLILGYSIIPPKFTGKIIFIQSSLDNSQAAYLPRNSRLDKSKPVSFSKLFTIGFFNQKNYENGFKKIVLRIGVNSILQ